MSKSDL